MIKKTVAQLIKRHQTNNPFELASKMNIHVMFEPLGNMLGYFNNYKRFPIIHINNELDEPLQRFTCAHELGHRVLHPNVNVPFLKANTFHSVDRIEREANKFAVELLIPDEVISYGCSIFDAAKQYGVPQEIAFLKSYNKTH